VERLAEAEGCELRNWPFLPPVKEVKCGHWIGLAENLSTTERRHLIAHALAHEVLHRGNQLSFHGWQKTAKVEYLPVWELADCFGVPEQLARRRVTEFATERELARWAVEDLNL